jgi:hypothetical protein
MTVKSPPPSSPTIRAEWPPSASDPRSCHEAVESEMAMRINEAARAWVEQMGRMRAVEADLGARLVACTSPREAVALTGDWMARRLDSLMALQRRLIDLWLALGEAALARSANGRGEEKDVRNT